MVANRLKAFIEFDQSSAWDDEVDNRRKLTARLLYTNIAPIDSAFRGIWPNDFVLLAAKTGSGKTELVTQIAMNVASQGKKVDLFALEASKYEIQRRIKFKILSKLHYDATGKTDVSYSAWMRFKLDDLFLPYQQQLHEQLDILRKNLRIHYRTSTFSLADFVKLYNYYAKDSSLMLCDHAQFFDFDDSQNEQRFVKDMTLKMYDMINTCEVPVVLVSHLRKVDDNKQYPNLNDIYGSSELSKKVTRALIVCRGSYDSEKNCFKTIFRFEKNREESIVAYETLFNLGLKQYSKTFTPGQIISDEFVPNK